MTMPHLMNCPHKGGTWCLACVREEWERREAIEAAKDSEIARLTAEVSTLRERCGRLVELYDATLDTLSDEASRYDLLRRDRAHAECVKHNDLTQGGSYD